jgi:hypothetical protein
LCGTAGEPAASAAFSSALPSLDVFDQFAVMVQDVVNLPLVENVADMADEFA